MILEMGICDLIGFLFVSYCVRQRSEEKKPPEKFHTEYQWSYINFTWPSVMEYHHAVTTFKYIPENNVITGIKLYNNRMYMALPRLRSGTPTTLAYVHTNYDQKYNALLRPYPSWSMNNLSNCAAFQSVQSIEIDKYGIMWVLDGVRFNGITTCPPKILLLDLNDNGKILQTHIFPNEVSLHNGGFLKYLVVDESDGGFAYITDNSMQDPGIVVYSRHFNRSWKLRDATMFAELDAAEFSVDDIENDDLMPVNGIALAPMPKIRDHERMVYYCALNGFNLYGITSVILKDEKLCKSGVWRKDIKMMGRKQSQSDGLTMDNKGNLYFGEKLVGSVMNCCVNLCKPALLSFLRRYCYIPPDDDNVPTNFESSTYAITSSKTNILTPMNTYKCSNYLQLKQSEKEDTLQLTHVSKIKTNLDDDAKTSAQSSHNVVINSYTKLDAGCNSKICNSSEENRANYRYTILPTISKNLSVCSSSYSSAYGPKSPQAPSSSQNQLLDGLSTCLWHCSLGCQ